MALLKRSCHNNEAAIMADEGVTWDHDSMTVTTAQSIDSNRGYQENIRECLHLPVVDLLRSKARIDHGEERASTFLRQGVNPNASITDPREADSDHISRATGLSHDVSTVNSELTNAFNDNRKMKYAANKLELAESKATIADKDATIRLLQQQMAELVAGVDNNSNLSDVDDTKKDASSVEVPLIGRNALKSTGSQSRSEDDSSSSSSESSLPSSTSSSSSSSTHTKPTDNIFDADENDSAARRRQESISSESGLWSDDVDMDSDAKEP